jgi:hypothetical protein
VVLELRGKPNVFGCGGDNTVQGDGRAVY